MPLQMPTADRRFAEGVQEYLDWCQRRGMAMETISGYRRSLNRCQRLLAVAGLWRGTKAVDEGAILHVRDHHTGEMPYTKQDLIIFGSYLEYHGNPVLNKMNLRWPPIIRPGVTWLAEEEVTKLVLEAENREVLILHLGLDLMLRRIEMQRLRLEDFDRSSQSLRVLGKGSAGGKVRYLPFHPDTGKYLELAKHINGTSTGPMFPNLKHPTRYGQPLCKTAMDKLLDNLSRRTGVRATFHGLRRTGARYLWLQGVKVETISRLLGHENTVVTLKYIGVNQTDMAEALRLGALTRGITLE